MRWILFFLLLIAPLVSDRAAAAIPRADLERFVKTERSAGREPQITKHFGTDLWGTDFSKLNLAGVDFQNADLGDCKFHGTDLRKAVFNGAHIYYAEFIDADLRGADFVGCRLDRCKFDQSDLRESTGFGIDVFMGVSAKGANLSGLNMSRCDLSEIDFTDADLSGCVFSYADGSGTNFTNAKLDQVEVKEFFVINATGLTQAQRDTMEQAGAIASPAAMEAAVRRGVSFTGRSLSSAQLSGLDLRGTDFSGCDLSSANFKNAKLQEAKFDNSKLSYAYFNDAQLAESSFINAEVYSAQFINAELSNANFDGAKLYSANFDHANLNRANFRNAEIDLTNFEKATGTPSPRLEILREQSGYRSHQIRQTVLEALMKLAPFIGGIAFVTMIIAASSMRRNTELHQWTKPLIVIAFLGIGLTGFLSMILFNSSSAGLPFLASLCVGLLVCLVGIFLGIYRLSQGQRKPNWASIAFFAAAPFPGLGIAAVVVMILAGMG
ncbi:hypothetical protein NT6N_28780 [Oceaniferula spumae]|uniref:Pentapeptide repeat-containing protein n=1 Tax=Oceaniferula spumae TaxID=2979115 RepID=A0AAT9FPC3_9BACT